MITYKTVDVKKLKHLLYVKKWSAREVGQYFGVSKIGVKQWIKKLNLPKRKLGEIIRPYWTGKKRHELGKVLSKKHKGKFRMEKNPAWKGGRTIRSGYPAIRVYKHPYGCSDHNKKYGRYVLEHRLIMENHLKRYLKPTELVHHIDGNRFNNSIDNLVITNRKSHPKIHKNIKAKLKRCTS